MRNIEESSVHVEETVKKETDYTACCIHYPAHKGYERGQKKVERIAHS